MGPLPPTRPDTVRFLEALGLDGPLTFGTHTDTDGDRPQPDTLVRTMHGTYSARRFALARLNRQGAAVLVMVNEGDGAGRCDHNVTNVRAVFVDLDGAPLEPVMAAEAPPAVVCETSPGKFHAYWPVTDMRPSEFLDAQKALAARFGGDPAVCNLARMMRLPGYTHAKREPFESRIVHCDPTAPWQWPELAARLGLPCGRTPEDGARQWKQGERNARLYRFACGLQKYEPAEALRRLEIANASYCTPPLPRAEVEAVLASAAKRAPDQWAKLPRTLTDNPAFRGLPHIGKVALIALACAYNGANNGRLTLTRLEAKAWGLNIRQRTKALDACELADLIDCTARGRSATPGRKAEPDFYRLLFYPP